MFENCPTSYLLVAAFGCSRLPETRCCHLGCLAAVPDVTGKALQGLT